MPVLLTELPEDPEARDSVTLCYSLQAGTSSRGDICRGLMSEVQRRGRRGEQWVNMGRQFRVTQTQWPGERRVKNDVNEGIGECGAVGELWADISWVLSHLSREGNSDMPELWGREQDTGDTCSVQCVGGHQDPALTLGWSAGQWHVMTSLNILTFSPNINSWNIWTCDKRTSGQTQCGDTEEVTVLLIVCHRQTMPPLDIS